MHLIWHSRRVTDIITCDKMFGDRFRGVDSVGGRKLPFPIDKASRRYHRAGATAQPVISNLITLNFQRFARSLRYVHRAIQKPDWF